MATFGPAQIAVTTRDGQESDDVTWSEDGFDTNGNRVGDTDGTVNYDMGMSWDNVTVPAGATITSATIEVFCKFASFAGDRSIVTRMQGFDVDDVAVFSATNRPSQIAQTTALVDRTYVIGEFADETFIALDDCAAIIQEIIDRPGWASGQALGVVLKDNGSPASQRWQFQDYGQSVGDGAKITIVYTEGGATTSLLETTNYQGMNRMNGGMRS